MYGKLMILGLLSVVCVGAEVHAQHAATLTWEQETDNDLRGFRIYRDNLSCAQLGPKQFVVEVGNVRTYTDTTVPESYSIVSYQITAIDTSNLESPKSNCAEKVLGHPLTAVGSITVVSSTATSLTLSLAAVDDGAGGTALYDVRYMASPFSWGSAAVATTCGTAGATCTITNLTPGTYQVQGITYRGTLNVDAVFGPLTEPITVVIPPTVNAPPEAPTNLRVTSVANGAALLAWDRAAGASRYEVKYLNTNKNQYVSFAQPLQTATETLSAPLPSRGVRRFQVCAINPVGTVCQLKAGVWATR